MKNATRLAATAKLIFLSRFKTQTFGGANLTHATSRKASQRTASLKRKFRLYVLKTSTLHLLRENGLYEIGNSNLYEMSGTVVTR